MVNMFIKIVLAIITLISFMGLIAESSKNKELSKHLTAVCVAAIVTLGLIHVLDK